MKEYLILALLIIFTMPILNIVLLYIFKNKYRPKIMFIIHMLTFLIPLLLFVYNREYAYKFFFCDAVSLIILFVSNKLYCILVYKVLSRIIYQISESPVVSDIYQVRKRIYTKTQGGYVLIDLQNETYNIYPDINSCAANDKTVFKRLASTDSK